jgi:hypothetical protein
MLAFPSDTLRLAVRNLLTFERSLLALNQKTEMRLMSEEVSLPYVRNVTRYSAAGTFAMIVVSPFPKSRFTIQVTMIESSKSV